MEATQSVLVTGSNSGFGRLIAETLARKRHTVFATMRGVDGKNAGAAKELGQWAAREDARVHVLELDVTDDASVDSAVRAAINSTGRIDAVVNNAGIAGFGHEEAFTTEQARRILDVNVLGPHRVNRAVLPHMRRQRSGVLVHISSVLGRFVLPTAGVYCASKFALEALAESYRYELAPLGIDSVIVEPGAYPTGIVHKALAPGDPDRIAGYGPVADLPQRIFGGFERALSGPEAPDPQEVADLIVELIEAPAGRRPLRVVVDRLTGPVAEEINESLGAAQPRILEQMGVGDCLELRSGVA